MRKKIYNKLKKAMTITVLTIGIFTNTLTAYAHTTEDLREFSGKYRIRTANFKEWLVRVSDRYNLYKHNSELAESLNRISFKTGNTEKYIELLNEQTSIEKDVGDLIANGSSANSILEYINRLEDVTKRANKYKEYAININLGSIDDLYASAEEAYKDVDYYMQAINSEDYEVGLIGAGSKAITGDNWSIYEGFGVEKSTGGKEQYTTGLKFNVTNSKVNEIFSQFRGKVARVIEDRYLVKTVVIEHGYGLETEIQGLNDVYVQEGDEVTQYELIGIVENKMAKGNELYIQDYVELKIKLDREYINPLLIYGTDGLAKYYTWVNANPGITVDSAFITKLKDEIVSNNEDDYSDGTMAIEDTGYEKAGTKIDINETLVPDRNDSLYNFND